MRAVAVDTVAHVPLLEFAESVVDGGWVPGFADFAEERFDHGGEQEPVVLAGLDFARVAHGGQQVLFRRAVELGPEFVGRAHDRQGEEGGIDQRLTVGAEVESVGRFGIGAVADGETRPLAIAGAEFLFGWVGAGRCFEPGSQAAEQAADGLEMRGLSALLLEAGDGFDGHGGAQFLPADGFEHRLRDALDDLNPPGTIRRRRWEQELCVAPWLRR